MINRGSDKSGSDTGGSDTGGSLFDEIQAVFTTAGAEPALRILAERLKSEKRYGELFKLRLMQIRLRNRLPVAESVSLEQLPNRLRGSIEQEYLEACREVGFGLLEQGRLRDAWRYLRAAGEQAAVATRLATNPADEQNTEELIEVALYEGAAPELGFELMLKTYGLCNAISAMDTVITQFPLAARKAAATMIVKALHQELVQAVSGDIAQRDGALPAEKNLSELLVGREWLFAEARSHVDVSHLAAVVRAARIVDDRAALELALELTEYGRRLSTDHRLPEEEPFSDTYAAHAFFFAAQLGKGVDEAVRYFRSRAESLAAESGGSFATEVYVALLARLHRYSDAIDVSTRLLPPGQSGSGLAPSLSELCRLAGDFTPLRERSRRENDAIGFATALICGAQTRR